MQRKVTPWSAMFPENSAREYRTPPLVGIFVFYRRLFLHLAQTGWIGYCCFPDRQGAQSWWTEQNLWDIWCIWIDHRQYENRRRPLFSKLECDSWKMDQFIRGMHFFLFHIFKWEIYSVFVFAGQTRKLGWIFEFHEEAGLCADGRRADVKKSKFAKCQICKEKSDSPRVSLIIHLFTEWPVLYKLPSRNEKEGIPAELLPYLDVCVEIPQMGVIRSLNVHVTGALFVWQYFQQHCLKTLS